MLFMTRYVVGSVAVLLLVYWLPASIYTILDLIRPACLYKYKVTSTWLDQHLAWSKDKCLRKYQVQPPQSQHSLSASALLNILALVLFNQVNLLGVLLHIEDLINSNSKPGQPAKASQTLSTAPHNVSFPPLKVSMGLVGCEVSWWLRYRWVEFDTPLHILPSFQRLS